MRELAIRIKDISIHALREEGDLERRCAIAGWPISIHALREEGDVFAKELCTTQAISIHALREEGDHGRRQDGRGAGDFYPRPPRGGRPLSVSLIDDDGWISIHALREEGDRSMWLMSFFFCAFLSTPSARRATCRSCRYLNSGNLFLSTPSARRATTVLFRICAVLCNFYPRPPRGGRRRPA